VKTKRSLIIGEPTNEQRLAVLDMIEDFSKLGTMVVVAYQERLPAVAFSNSAGTKAYHNIVWEDGEAYLSKAVR
jgi:hypothetical protein